MIDSSLITVFVHIVTYQSGPCVFNCLETLLRNDDPDLHLSLIVQVTENGSDITLPEKIRQRFGETVRTRLNDQNLGFAAAHNQGAADFLSSGASLFFILNPDVEITRSSIRTLAGRLLAHPDAAMATPLLLRPVEDGVTRIDAAGMVLLPSLRHFDRGSEEVFSNQYQKEEFVFGGTGAALLLAAHGVSKLSLRGELYDADVLRVFPQLEDGRSSRVPLFDEAFFAYREDADLAWRARHLGLRCLFVPAAIAIHSRRVTPERRHLLPTEINRHSVRNRFLLQLNNFFPSQFITAIVPGFVIRNTLVLLGLALKERSSLPALNDVRLLLRRQLERRRLLRAAANKSQSQSRQVRTDARNA